MRSALVEEERREQVVICPKLPDGFWTCLPDVQRIDVPAEPEPPLPLPTARVVDELLWRSALAKREAAKRCEKAARTIDQAHEIRMRVAARRAARAR